MLGDESFVVGRAAASMRPGQAAPECQSFEFTVQVQQRGFNEAGAGCPGMPAPRPSFRVSAPGFNEAGAGCPGMPANDMQLLELIKWLQ